MHSFLVVVIVIVGLNHLHAVFQTTHMSYLDMDNPALHLAHNNFENNARAAFSELRRDEAFSDVQLVCDDDSGVAVVTTAHKVTWLYIILR